MKKQDIWIIGLALFLAALLIWTFSDRAPQRKSGNAVSYQVIRQWRLPDAMEEVSGIAWLTGERLATIQDEFGEVSIFDLGGGKTVERFQFAEAGDFEAVTTNGKDMYVLRSDGTLFEILNFAASDREVKQYPTFFTMENNMESLAFDQAHNRLLLVPKLKDPEGGTSKGVYTFSLGSKELDSVPEYRIDLTDDAFRNTRQKDLSKVFRPSDMAIHPMTGEIYILDGVIPQLLILEASGELRDVYSFSAEFFPQPEGIAFSPDGTLYISNEGEKDVPATITQLVLENP